MPTLKENKDKVRELSKRGLEIAESTTMTFAEQKKALDPIEADIKQLMDDIAELEYVEEKRKAFMKAAGNPIEDAAADTSTSAGAAETKSLGQQFVESQQFKSLKGGMNGNWTSGQVELKTTLTEGTAAAPGPGYQPTNQPNVLPGVVDIRFRPLTIADLFPQGTTDSPLIRYLVESAVTNAAAATAEGGVKPESALAFAKVDETLKKVATFLPVSDEMLEDWAQTRSYIDARLGLFVAQAEETQLLSGDGTGANLVGLLNRSGLTTAIVKGTAPSVAGDNSMDAIYRQITAIRVGSWIEPDAIVVDPQGWQTIAIAKNSQGAYYANGPFADIQGQTLWGKRVAVTPAIAANSALVGGFAQGGQIFRKGGLRIEASNSHADFFQKDLTAIRAERRLALAIYRPGAFGIVSNL